MVLVLLLHFMVVPVLLHHLEELEALQVPLVVLRYFWKYFN